MKMKHLFFDVVVISAAAFLAACSGESPTSSSSPEPGPAAPAVETETKPAKRGEDYGTLKLKFGDEAVEVTTFKKLGTELILSGPGAGIRLAGTDGEVFSLTYTVNEGEEATGKFVSLSATPVPEGERVAMLSVMDFLKSERSVSFNSGDITVTKCDADGNFAATFEGEGISASDPANATPVPFSGSIDVKVQ